MWFSISVFLSQQSQFVLHHQVWITHHFTLSWICKGTEQNKCQDLYSEWCLGDWRCGGGGQILTVEDVFKADGLVTAPQSVHSQVWTGQKWHPLDLQKAVTSGIKDGSVNFKQMWKVERCNRAVDIGEGERHAVTCRAALYSICSLRGAWRPWMFRSVEKLSLSLFSWNCKPNAQISFDSGV